MRKTNLFRTDGSVFNLRRLQAKTKVKETSVSEFLFDDAAALNIASEIKMQKNMHPFSAACNNFGLTISIAKTDVMYQLALQKAYSEPTIAVGNETLKVTDRFCYLGSTLSSSANIDAEVENRIAKASSTCGHLQKTVWERRGIKTSTKVKVYRATVIPTLLYACETWTLYERQIASSNAST